ncbi:hypothetical protein Zmor_025607 [Zophobas morio]|uniref:C2H2-type domain-containing protein n=1 Tax=Zophobas morio TaxID=2755281 RepID=A0AA38HRR4_9CUCU|nr:hypothetical protein Zmor_025607 [Zophobas morio]
MEDNFALTWEDSAAVVQGEEVICSIENEILPAETSEFTGVQQPEEEEEEEGPLAEPIPEPEGNIVYITEDNVLVMQPTNTVNFQDQFMEVAEDVAEEVAEEIVTEQWDESCPEEIVVGSEEAVGNEEQTNEDFDIPLPTDQDEYTASRPYPCDFCSRRFRKKANLMNHMVAHQTDRPHGCNLCGVRYIRKCDLMNHLKIHAYIPETDGLEEEDVQQLDESDGEKRSKRKQFPKRKKNRIKEEYDSYEGDEAASSSRSYNYVDEDMRLMEAMENNVKGDYADYGDYMAENQPVEVRYPITDPRKPFVCQHCGVGFAREKALASHARIHGGDSPFECQKCGEMFWDVALMREHVRSKHGDIEDFDDDEDEDYSEEDTKYGTFYCSTCGLSFHRQDNLKRHQRVHIKEEYINDHEFGHICNVCGESFPEALDLLAHAEVHARGSEHRCMICGEVCTDDQAVAAHVQSKHGKNLPPNTCMLCGRTCKDRRTLLKHSWEHSKEKSFACSKCAKTFHNKARLKRHMLSHRNKIVSCDVCGEEFPDGRSLMNHRHSHSSLSGRQFPCRECGKTFGSRSSQQIHIRIHTGERPYGCRFCWKAFADGGTLRKHERIHTGEKPYACAVCPRAFNQRVVLREHIRSHHSGPDPKYTHSVTPYCCSVCSDMFATSQDLIVHLIHHCDLNTAMKRQPQVGPRKYKRRRKLKPHELELISNKADDEVEEEEEQPHYTDSEEERELRKKKQKNKKPSPKPTLNETYTDLYNSCSSAIENINSIVNSKSTSKSKRKIKAEPAVPSRPKMIHTQKTRVPVETGEDGKVRHKTKTLVTRTQPTELKSATGERIRPRTKNVSYHILNSEKLPLATFPDDDTEQAVNSLLKEDQLNDQSNGVVYMEQTETTPEVAAEQVVETEMDNGPVPTNIIKVTSTPTQLHNLRPGRTIIGPGSKVVRLVKGGMIITKNKKMEPENILPDIDNMKNDDEVRVKQEVVDASPLHELAELSMQHAQNMFKCEMCSAVFDDRAKLLDHVPIHI